jgi:hypothetical protein
MQTHNRGTQEAGARMRAPMGISQALAHHPHSQGTWPKRGGACMVRKHTAHETKHQT